MEIRVLQDRELLPALHLVWGVFVEEIAPTYTQEGVREFQNFIKYDNMYAMFQRKEIMFFGAFEGETLCGVMAVKSIGHICLFYVEKQWQGKGLGRLLFEAVQRYCFYTLRVNRITVNAALGAVTKYTKFGFQATQEEVQNNGMRYVPMELQINPRNVDKTVKRSKTPIIIAIVAGVVFLCVLIGVGLMFFAVRDMTRVEKSYSYSQKINPFDDNQEDYDDYDDFNDYDGSLDDAKSGIDSIGAYEEPGLTYDVEEKDYTFSDSKSKTTVVDFQVKYPNVTGLDSNVSDKVNDALKACAMKTVDKIYTNPTDEIKERVLGAENPALVSYVSYKVTYLSKDFISVVFEDNSYQGSYELVTTELRTMNINLKDGTVYEVKDVVTIDDTFLTELRKELEDEADNSKFLSELTNEDLKKSLEGDSLNGVYNVAFFADEDGVEIGYSLKYPVDDTNDFGYAWVTAPFDFDELTAYRAEGGIWEVLK